jgi:RIO kinase 1
MRSIQEFIDEGLISEVLNVVKSGKEATVYRCRADGSLGVPFAAAKVYHSSSHRSFKRAAIYEEGRVVAEGQVRRALEKKTEFGHKAQLGLWVDHEFQLLSNLQYAGVDVPIPFACTETAVLMEYVGAEDDPAVQLQHAQLAEGEAEGLFDRVLEDVEAMMRQNVVHGDLSAFNILYHRGRIAIIDFPQAVDPRQNQNAKTLLERDIAHVLQYFARHQVGLDEDAGRMARNLFNLWRYGEL